MGVLLHPYFLAFTLLPRGYSIYRGERAMVEIHCRYINGAILFRGGKQWREEWREKQEETTRAAREETG